MLKKKKKKRGEAKCLGKQGVTMAQQAKQNYDRCKLFGNKMICSGVRRKKKQPCDNYLGDQ